MNNIIQKFSIRGFLGKYDVDITFKNDVMIIVGENGIGKTQILNILYYVLSKDFEKLAECKFSHLSLIGINENKFSINQNYVNAIIEEEKETEWDKWNKASSLLKDFSRKINQNIDNQDYGDINRKDLNKKISKERIIFNRQIDNILGKNKILYLQTYRLIEIKLATKIKSYEIEDITKNNLIRFGMENTREKFKWIESRIIKLLRESSPNITSRIFNEFLYDDTLKPNKFVPNKISLEDVAILLSRIEDANFSKEKKEQIKQAISSKEIDNKPQMQKIIQILVDEYASQKPFDAKICQFRDTCNKYLINKQVIYDESAIKIFIQDSDSKNEIDLDNLSAGEKQLISIFAQLYLDTEDNKYILLFDGPEIGLSVNWQKELLPDILKSNNCSLLLAATHSPFIFENELDQYAVGLNMYIQPIKK